MFARSMRGIGVAALFFFVQAAAAAVPVGQPDTYNISKNTVLTVTAPGVLSNDSDPDADPLTGAVLTGFVASGGLVWDANGAFVYTPDPAFVGQITFTYAPFANGDTGADTLITINITNDPPVAVNDNYTAFATENLVVNAATGVLANDTDANSDALTAAIVTPPANAASFALASDGSFSYLGAGGFCGDDTFTYRVNDGTVDGNTATVTVHVNCPPTTVDDFYVTPQGVALVVPEPGVLLNDSDPDGDSLGSTLTGFVAPGALVWNNIGGFTYTPPDPSFVGTITFTYRSDAAGRPGNEATITVKVNGAPVGVDDMYSVSSGVTRSVAAPGVLANDTDGNSDPLTAILDTDPTHGTVTLNPDGSFDYTPDPGYIGPDSFTYHPNDGTVDGSVATVTLNVIVNGPPVAVDDAYAVNEDATLSVPAPGVLFNDTDVDPLTAAVVDTPDHGTLTLNPDGSFDYTPDPDYSGPDAFTYRANDGVSDSNVATVTIDVQPLNDLPVGTDDEYAILHDTVLTVPAPGVLANDVDADGDTMTASQFFPPFQGTLVLAGDGSFTYTPNPGFEGEDSFRYRINDGTGNSGQVTVTITVTASLADLSVEKTSSARSFTPGGEVSFTITVTNGGPDTAANVIVQDDVPPGTTFVSATPSQGSCDSSVTCTLGELANSQSATITFVLATTTVTGAFTNTATATHNGGDPDSANDSASAAVVPGGGIPTLSEWMLLALAAMLAAIAMRRS